MKCFVPRCRSIDIILWPSLFSALLLVLGLNALQVNGASMEPVLHNGQTVFINRFAYGLDFTSGVGYLFYWGTPQKGEIIVFKHPDGGHLSVKRSVLVAGDNIRLSADRLRADNRSWRITPYVASQLAGLSEIPTGHVFVVGENPAESSDSRDFGLVPLSKVLGRVITL